MLLQVLLDSLNLAVYSSTSSVPLALSHFSSSAADLIIMCPEREREGEGGRERENEKERGGRERFVSTESIQCYPLGPFHLFNVTGTSMRG